MEPSGYELRIEICPSYGASATAVKGSHSLEFGDIQVELSSCSTQLVGAFSSAESM